MMGFIRMNVVNVIIPYPYAGTWVFDDETRGLKAEPFIFGMPEIIDQVTQKALGHTDRKKFRLIFSATGLPLYHIKLEKVKNPQTTIKNPDHPIFDLMMVGAWYKVAQSPFTSIEGMTGWLCPATLQYFDDYPDEIYLYVEQFLATDEGKK